MALQHFLVEGKQVWPILKLSYMKTRIPRWTYTKNFNIRLHSQRFSAARTKSSLIVSDKNIMFVPSHSNKIQICKYYDSKFTSVDIWDEGKEEDEIASSEAKMQLDHIFLTKSELSESEWQDIISLTAQVIPTINEKNCDALMMMQCLRKQNLALGQSYMKRLSCLGREANLATLGTYLLLCGRLVDQCGEDTVLQIYEQLISKSKVLDVRLSRSVVVALSSTQEWHRALNHLEYMRKMSWMCSDSYSAFISAAFRNSDYDLGWHYLDIICGEGKEPQDAVFFEWLKQCHAAEDLQDTWDRINMLFHKLATLEIFPTVPVVSEITQLFQKKLGWSARYVNIPSSGVCPACRVKLPAVHVSKEEFQQLQEEFVSCVVERSDIFLSSSPEEWSNFQKFVEANRPFSLVMDGLNLFYLRGNKNRLDEVVQAVLDRVGGDGRVLMIGRDHMRHSVPRAYFVRNRIIFYTVKNISRDDAFFLYAALMSGWGTKFITCDQLRDHVHRLELPLLRVTFRRWQRAHQIVPEANRYLRLLGPTKFGAIAQGDEGRWHVPYESGAPKPSNQSYQAPRSWVCLHPTSHTTDAGSHCPTQPGVAKKHPKFYSVPDAAAFSVPYTSAGHQHHKSVPGVSTSQPRYKAYQMRNHGQNEYQQKNKSKKKLTVLIDDVLKSPED